MKAKHHNLATNAVLNCLRVGANIVIPLITFPYLTRVLHVANFGKVSRCSNIMQYFTLLAGLGINNYAIREGARLRSDQDGLTRFSSEIFTIHLVSTFVTYVIMIGYLLLWNIEAEYKTIVLILSLSIISGTIGFGWLPNVMEDFGYITARVLGIHILSMVAVFIFVKESNDYIKYAWITGITSVLSGLFNIYYASKHIKIRIATSYSWKKHLTPILVLFANTLMITIYLQSDITMIGAIKGDYEVGLYKTSVQIYSAIKTLFNAVTAVVIPRLIKLLSENRKEDYNKLASTVLNTLAYLCIPAMVGLFLVADNCILFVGGREYIESASSLRILSFALIVAVFGNFFANAILIANRQEKKAFMATIISAIVNVGLNFILIPTIGFIGAALTTMIAEIVVAVMLCIQSKEFVKIRVNKAMIVPLIIGLVAIVGICYIISRLELGLIMDTVAKIGLSVVCFGAISLAFKGKLNLRLK